MTLVEILVAVFILTVGIVGSLLFLVNAMTATETARDLTTATTHAESVLEEMKSRLSLDDIQLTDWKAWAKAEGFDSLPNEQLDVQFEPPGGNPLKIDVTIRWARVGRPAGKVEMYTEMGR